MQSINQGDMNALVAHLRSVTLRGLAGEWVGQASHYEDALAVRLGMTSVKDRLGDAMWNGVKIEFKKGRGRVWLDLVRLAEHILTPAASPVVMLFFHCHDDYVQRIYAIDTADLAPLLKMDVAAAELTLSVWRNVPVTTKNFQVELRAPLLTSVAKVVIDCPAPATT